MCIRIIADIFLAISGVIVALDDYMLRQEAASSGPGTAAVQLLESCPDSILVGWYYRLGCFLVVLNQCNRPDCVMIVLSQRREAVLEPLPSDMLTLAVVLPPLTFQHRQTSGVAACARVPEHEVLDRAHLPRGV